MNHAILPPSGAAQWVPCPGSAIANAENPRPETAEMRAGTASHWVAAECLKSWRDKSAEEILSAADFSTTGITAPSGVVIDAHMAEGAQFYVDEVLQVAQRHGALQDLLIEQRVDMPGIEEQGLNWGTLDATIHVPKKSLIHIFDYKSGHRETVAKENWQLINYANGLANKLGLHGLRDSGYAVVFHIVQPFAYRAANKVDVWEVALSDLRGYFNQLADSAHQALHNPTFTTGPHCRDCGTRMTCKARRQADYNFIDLVGQPNDLDAMTGEDLADERTILTQGLAVAKSRLGAIEDHLKHMISAGQSVPGLTVKASTGRLDWVGSVEASIAFAQMFFVDASTSGVLTPQQVTKLVPKELKQTFGIALKNVTARSSTGYKLIAAADSVASMALGEKQP